MIPPEGKTIVESDTSTDAINLMNGETVQVYQDGALHVNPETFSQQDIDNCIPHGCTINIDGHNYTIPPGSRYDDGVFHGTSDNPIREGSHLDADPQSDRVPTLEASTEADWSISDIGKGFDPDKIPSGNEGTADNPFSPDDGFEVDENGMLDPSSIDLSLIHI